MNTTQKLKIVFHLNMQRAKNSEAPLYCKIVIDSARAQFATPYKIDPAIWDKKNMFLTGSGSTQMVVNAYIHQVKSELNNHFLRAVASNRIISAKELKAEYLGIEIAQPKKKTLSDAFDFHIAKLQEKLDAKLIHKNTMLRYKATKSKMLDFIKAQYRIKSIALDELKYSFITEFEHYLLTKEKLLPNTAHKNLINLKKVIKVAVQLEWLTVSPFTQFQCKYRNPERVFLTQDELDRIKNKTFTIDRLTKVRDVFLFQCYTGFSFADIFKFDQNALSIGIDGDYWITTHRSKTGNRESVPLLPIAMEIIQKYKDHEECIKKNTLLPVNTNERYNSYLKEIADACEIRKNITTHVARHTFATTVTLSNGVPIETVSKMLGHTKLATTQIYAKVLDRKVSEDMKVLREKLDQKSNEKQNKNKDVI
jgi:site-specific recombinase XerD